MWCRVQRPLAAWLAMVVLGAPLTVAPPAAAFDVPAPYVGESAHSRDRFYVQDRHRYGSPWYAGAHRKMIPYGCTRAPYYPPSDRCAKQRGFHHGLDIAMPCGNRLDAGLAGRVVGPSSPGALGPAYGRHAFRLRNFRHDVDIVIGHVRRVFVSPGERVQRGQRIARASDAGAPDGCHLHFEVRPIAAGYSEAMRPGPYLRLHP